MHYWLPTIGFQWYHHGRTVQQHSKKMKTPEPLKTPDTPPTSYALLVSIPAHIAFQQSLHAFGKCHCSLDPYVYEPAQCTQCMASKNYRAMGWFYRLLIDCGKHCLYINRPIYKPQSSLVSSSQGSTTIFSVRLTPIPPGDLDLSTWHIYHPFDLHAKIQVWISVPLAIMARWADEKTHS